MYHIHGDKRVNASVQLITQALLELLEEKPFSRITVADLQRRSTVSRSTFYRCFDRTEDVLAYLCDTGFDKVLEQDLPDAQTLSAQVFRYWMRNTAVLEALVEVRRTDILFSSLRRCLSRMDHFPALSDSAAENDYFIAIVTSVITGILTTWIEHGKQETEEQVFERVSAGMVSAILLVAG